MYTTRVEGEFAAAHFLSHYRGKCENLHGHNYRVRVWVRGEKLSEGGMVVDFGALKQCLKGVLEPLDHHSLNDMAVFANAPTAERIARYVFEQVECALSDFSVDPSMLWAVDVFETPINMARYER